MRCVFNVPMDSGIVLTLKRNVGRVGRLKTVAARFQNAQE